MQTNRLRIIGGRWRGRSLAFPALVGIRPTPDRVRETLFNWLREATPGARCLDLFAGSGALGLEALSRGAAETLFVERERRAAEAIRGHLRRLGVAQDRRDGSDESGADDMRGDVLSADFRRALRALTGRSASFDIVFLDPPFGAGLLAEAMRRLAASGALAPGAWIYLETAQGAPPAPLPASWRILRSGSAGAVGYWLVRSLYTDPLI